MNILYEQAWKNLKNRINMCSLHEAQRNLAITILHYKIASVLELLLNLRYLRDFMIKETEVY